MGGPVQRCAGWCLPQQQAAGGCGVPTVGRKGARAGEGSQVPRESDGGAGPGKPRSYLPPDAGAPAAISYLPLRLPIGPPHYPSSAPPCPGRASPLAESGTAPSPLADSNRQRPIRAHGGGGERPPTPRAACCEL